MNRSKWNDAIYELENMIRYKAFDQARERLAALHRSFAEDDHELSLEDHYTILLNIAGCYVDLGFAANDDKLLEAGRNILKQHEKDFPHFINPENRPVHTPMPLVRWKSAEEEDDWYAAWPAIVIFALFIIFQLVAFFFY